MAGLVAYREQIECLICKHADGTQRHSLRPVSRYIESSPAHTKKSWCSVCWGRRLWNQWSAWHSTKKVGHLNTFLDKPPKPRCAKYTRVHSDRQASWNGPIVKWKVEERLRRSPRRHYSGVSLVALLHFIAELLFIKRGFYLCDAAVSAAEGS